MYCLGVEEVKSKNKTHPLIRVMNWGMMARLGIIDESAELAEKSSIGTVINILDGKYKFVKASSHFKKQFDVELLLQIDKISRPTFVFRTTSGWDLKKL